VQAPLPDWKVGAYGDGSTGGTSRVLSLSPIQGGWQLACDLRSQGFSYCGLSLAAPAGDSSVVDLRDLADIELTIRKTSNGLAKVILAADDPAITRPNIPLSHRYSEAKIDRNQGHVSLAERDFRLATWWLDLGMVPPDETERRLDRVHELNVQINAKGSSALDTLEVTDLVIHTRRAPLWPGILGLWGLSALLAGIQWRRRTRSRSLPHPIEQGVPAPAPLALKSSNDEARDRLVAWLREHYMDSTLDAEAVARGTGIPKDRLATLLRDAYGMPFKPFLNELRLTEATRLLRDTDRSVSEIAFAVGYNTHTHFSRIFRERHACSPVEWREQNIPPADTAPPPG